MSARTMVISCLILFAAASRLVPHPPNFAPIGALALFGGATFRTRYAFLIPVVAMVLSDWLLGFHSLMLVVYACFGFNFLLGKTWVSHDAKNPIRIGLATIIGSCVFFVVTNFACWLSFYDRDLAGLTNCYVAALPFFRNSLLGDLVYATALFGALALAEWRLPSLRFNAARSL